MCDGRHDVLVVEAVGGDLDGFEEGVVGEREGAEVGVGVLLHDENVHERVVEEMRGGVRGNDHRVVCEALVAHPVACVDGCAGAIVLRALAAAQSEGDHAAVLFCFRKHIRKVARAVTHSVLLIAESLVA